MDGNTERFSGRVEAYARFRARYPAGKVLGFLREVCGLEPGWRVADVGAGTGMLAEVFLENGNRVVAVEPNPEMRAVCAGLREQWAGLLEVQEGSAETTGLAERSVHMVAAGRAFHWFDPEGAEREFRRVLIPGGWVVLAGSGPWRDESEQGKELEELQEMYGMRARYVTSREGRETGVAAFFRRLAGVEESVGEVHWRAEFLSERRLGWEAFAGFVQSLSGTPREGQTGYEEMRLALEAYFGRWSMDGELILPERCYVNLGRVSG